MRISPGPSTGSILAKSLLGLLASLLSWGCIAVIPYEPSPGLVAARGFDEVSRECQEVLARAINPHVGAVDVTPEFLHYGWNETYLGPIYMPITVSHENRIYFANVARIEVYENNNVFLWGPGDQRVDKILFGNLEDAKLFVDCFTSLRANRERS